MLENKTAVVTGGASGIGAAICAELAKKKCKILIADIDVDNATEVASKLNSMTQVIVEQTDSTDPESVARAVNKCVQEWGTIDYIFNNAGIALKGDVLDTSLQDWDRLTDINIRGVVHGVHAAYPIMVEQGHGHIVNTASLAGLMPSPSNTAYAMTKSAVVGLSNSLRCEAKRFGVKVSVVCPGLIDTPIVKSMKVVTGKSDLQDAHMTAEDCATDIIKGVEKDRAVIPVSKLAHIMYRLNRHFPNFTLGLMMASVKKNNFLRPLPESE